MTKELMISDHEQVRNIFLKFLEEEGFDLIGEENDFIGSKQTQQLSDFVICNIKMPELNGYAVLTKLRQSSVKAIIPFIFLTAKSKLNQNIVEADESLDKPSGLKELLRAIATQLEKQEAQQIRASSLVETVPADQDSILPNDPQLSQVFEFIETNYHQPISLCDVALAVGYSAAYLTDLVKRQTGESVHQWIIKRRMAAACSLLQETDQSIEQIAEAVGYRYTGCFFRQFRQSFGTTPQVWRNAKRHQDSTKQK